MFLGRLGLLALPLLFACVEDERAPVVPYYYPRVETPDGSISLGDSRPSITAGRTGLGDRLSSSEVFLFGTVPGADGCDRVIMDPWSPGTFRAGACGMTSPTVRPSDGAVIYLRDGNLYEMVCDGPCVTGSLSTPIEDPLSNDLPVEAKGCMEGTVRSFTFAGRGGQMHLCTAINGERWWLDATGRQILRGGKGVLAFSGKLALTQTEVIDYRADVEYSLPLEWGVVHIYRAESDGFYIVHRNGRSAVLRHVDYELNLETVGSYPLAPKGATLNFGAVIDSRERLHEVAELDGTWVFMIRYPNGDEPHIVMQEDQLAASEPRIARSGGIYLTGN